MTLDDASDMRIHQSIENVFTVLMAKHLLPRKELRERVQAFCEADEDEERSNQIDAAIAQACGGGE